MLVIRANLGGMLAALMMIAFGSGAVGSGSARAQAPDSVARVLPAGQLPDDRRLGPLQNLNGEHPFHPPVSKAVWEKRAERLRRQTLVAAGLWPMPTRTPLQAVVHGKVDRDGYTVEKVYFQSFPGHFVSGNLFRPRGGGERRPAVLSAHGHGGRFEDSGPEKVRQLIADGEERFEVGGRYRTQARCVQLVRMGCVVFQYDMVGYGDSGQLKHGAQLREPLDTLENWGYASAQAEAHLQNPLGLQTYNSLCAFDFLCALPDVDPQRIAVLGSSGGGTQTILLCAVDPRPAVAFPAVMVSAETQGGCSCENACYLRMGTGNVEIAALMAPRPLGMTGANDWTRLLETKGLPELKQLYRLLGAEDRVMGKVFPLFPHGWSYPARGVMYRWLNKHLRLGLPEPIVEEDFLPLSKEEMTVWDADHPRPAGGDDYERSLLGWITADEQAQLTALLPRDEATLDEQRRIIGGAVDILIGRSVPDPQSVQISLVGDESRTSFQLRRLLVRYPAEHEELPAVALVPPQANREVVLWISTQGKRGLFDAQGLPRAAVGKLLAAGRTVVGVDLFGQGEFTHDGEHDEKNRIVTAPGNDSWRTYAGFTYGYNYPLFAQRAQDILTIVGALGGKPFAAETIHLVGLEGAGHWAAAARAQAGATIGKTVIDTAGFRFASLRQFDDPDFLPGGAKYLDLPGIMALAAPHALWLAGETAAPAVVAAAYRAAGQTQRLTVFGGQPAEQETAAVRWLLE